MVSRLEDGFQYKVESMWFDTGAQALLVYADTHNQFMIGGGNKADLGLIKEIGAKHLHIPDRNWVDAYNDLFDSFCAYGEVGNLPKSKETENHEEATN